MKESVSLTLTKGGKDCVQCRYFFPLTCLARARGGFFTTAPRNLYEIDFNKFKKQSQGG